MLVHPITDHLPVLMCFYTKEINLKQEIKTRIFNQSNIHRFYQELEKIVINSILQETDQNVVSNLSIDKYTDQSLFSPS